MKRNTMRMHRIPFTLSSKHAHFINHFTNEVKKLIFQRIWKKHHSWLAKVQNFQWHCSLICRYLLLAMKKKITMSIPYYAFIAKPLFFDRLFHWECSGMTFIHERPCIKKRNEWSQQLSEFVDQKLFKHFPWYVFISYQLKFFLSDQHILKIGSKQLWKYITQRH